MKNILLFTFPLLLALSSQAQWKYPATRTVDASDTYFGKTYKDSYRWLEQSKDTEVDAWFKAQAELTDRSLAKIAARDTLADEWMALDKLKPATYNGITFENGRVFYKKTLGGENVGKLYFREEWQGPEKLLFDPVPYKSGENTVIQSFVPSWDGRHVVLGLTAGGAEYSELRVLVVDEGKLLPEKIYPSYGGYGWNKDGACFFYDAGKVTDIKSLEIELNRKTRIHKLGSKVEEDTDFFSNESYPDLGIAPKEFPVAQIDESYPDYVFGLIATVQAETRLLYAPVSEMSSGGKIKWKVVCNLSDNIVRGFTAHDRYVYAITHTGAPKYKVVRTPLEKPDWAHAEVVVPEAKDSVQSLTKSRHYLLVVFSNGINCRLVKYDLATGKVTEVKLPGTGTVDVSCPDWRTDLCHVVITSWTQPATRYDYDAQQESFTKSIFNTDVSYPGFENLVTEEVEVPSHDGTSVPLSVVYRKGIPMDGSNCCILDGYGAYGYSYTPYFDIKRSVALRGVVLAFAHPRGGSEKGETWYKAGYKTTKPNTWKDYIACAEYLVKKGYTRPDKLAEPAPVPAAS